MVYFFITKERKGKKIQDHIPSDCTEIRLNDVSKLNFLCDFLQSNTTVKYLYLQGNRIGDEGLKAIVNVLKVNRTVTQLDLSGNQIGDKGAKAIAEALKVNCTITTLNLCSNQIKNEGAKAISEALKVNCIVKYLNLYGNPIDKKSQKFNDFDDEDDGEFEEEFDDSDEYGEFDELLDIRKELKVNVSFSKEWRQMNMKYMEKTCKTLASGLLQKVPIYLILDIYELVVCLDLERKTNSHKFYNNAFFLKLLESKISKKHLLSIIDKKNQKLIVQNEKIELLKTKRKRKSLDKSRDANGQKRKMSRKD